MQVRIIKPAKTAMSSGIRKTKKWMLQFPPMDRPDPNDLMGWAESCDTVKQMRLEFISEQEAIAYCQKKGWEYMVLEPEQASPKSKSYADNFRFTKFT